MHFSGENLRYLYIPRSLYVIEILEANSNKTSIVEH